MKVLGKDILIGIVEDSPVCITCILDPDKVLVGIGKGKDILIRIGKDSPVCIVCILDPDREILVTISNSGPVCILYLEN
jgi:hypothetical protein